MSEEGQTPKSETKASPKDRAWQVFALCGLAIILLCALCLDNCRTLHSFRIAGSLSRLSIRQLAGNWVQVDLSRTPNVPVEFEDVADALIHLDSGRVALYAPSRPSPVELTLPSTVRLRGKFVLSISPASGGLVVAAGGRVNSLRYGDATIGSLEKIEKYGSQLVPSVLDEYYKQFLTVAAVFWAFLQLLKLLKDLLAKQP